MIIAFSQDNLPYEWTYRTPFARLEVIFYSDHPQPTIPGLYLVSFNKIPCIYYLIEVEEKRHIARTISMKAMSQIGWDV